MTHLQGSLAWAETNEGRLNKAEKLRLVLSIARLQVGRVLDKIGRVSGLTTPLCVALEDTAVPDTRLVHYATDLAGQYMSQPLLLHCWRTWYFGMALGQVAGLKPDPEILFSAAMLHDLGLTEGDHLSPLEQCCFAVSGGRFARQRLEKNGFERQAEAIAEAISLHLNLMVSASRHGPEAHLLARGACCDVFGAGLDRLADASVQAVIAQYPRDGLIEALKIESAGHLAGSRAAFMGQLFAGKAPPDAFARYRRD